MRFNPTDPENYVLVDSMDRPIREPSSAAKALGGRGPEVAKVASGPFLSVSAFPGHHRASRFENGEELVSALEPKRTLPALVVHHRPAKKNGAFPKRERCAQLVD